MRSQGNRKFRSFIDMICEGLCGAQFACHTMSRHEMLKEDKYKHQRVASYLSICTALGLDGVILNKSALTF